MRISKPPEVRRQEIIDMARVLFEEQGVARTSMTEIAERIGIAKGLVYYYFSSKEQLAEAIVDQLIAGLDENLLTIVSENQLDFHVKLTGILGAFFRTIRSHPTVLAYSPSSPGMSAQVRERLYGIALKHAGTILREADQRHQIRIEFPEYMLRILIRGLGDLYIEGVHEPEVHATLIEQTLGLEKGLLRTQSFSPAAGPSAPGPGSGDRAVH